MQGLSAFVLYDPTGGHDIGVGLCYLGLSSPIVRRLPPVSLRAGTSYMLAVTSLVVCSAHGCSSPDVSVPTDVAFQDIPTDEGTGGVDVAEDTTSRCDVIDGTGCATGQRCIPDVSIGSRCVASGEGTQDDPCGLAWDPCSELHLCVGEPPTLPYRCRRICGSVLDCNAGEICDRETTVPGLSVAGFCR